jgi:hypothetical protein
MNILPTPTHAQVFYIKKDQIISGLFHSSYALLTYAQYVALLYFLKALALITKKVNGVDNNTDIPAIYLDSLAITEAKVAPQIYAFA